jgi:hypothetical protein
MWLTGEDKRLLHEALVSAFYNVQLLREMVTYRRDQQLDRFTDGTLDARVYQLIAEAEAGGWLGRLIDGAHAHKRNPQLAAFHLRFATAPHARAEPSGLERIVKQSRALLDPVAVREAIELHRRGDDLHRLSSRR